MFELQAKFTGAFDQDSQVKPVPRSLLALVNIIHYGPNIESQRFDDRLQETLSVAQLLKYNSSVHQRARCTDIHHNTTKQEKPLFLSTWVLQFT